MVRSRRGAGKIGCLFMTLVVVVMCYFGVGVAEVFWNYYQYKDRMQSEARFAAHRSDAVIKRRVADFADSLGLPEGARNVIVRRGDHTFYIFADYYDHVELPWYVREIHLNPSATGTC